MKKKVEKKCMIIIIIILSIGVSVLFIYKITKNGETRKNKDVRQCVEKKLEIKLGKGVTLVEGEAYDDEYGEEYVKAKFAVEKKSLQKLEMKLKEGLNEYSREEIELFCNFKREDIWLDLKEKKIQNFYNQFREGKKAKSIEINAFIATDDTGEYYFYIFY